MPDRSSETGHRDVPVNAKGNPSVDPTRNVLDLVDAAVQRQDDLREQLEKLVDSERVSLKQYLRDLLDAHNTRYEQRHEALQQMLRDAVAVQKDALRDALESHRDAFQASLNSAAMAVSKAEAAAEKRFDGVNEFRAQLGDQQRTLMPRVEAEKTWQALAEKVGVLEGFRTEMLSRGTGAKEGYGWAIGLVSLVLTVLMIISAAIVLASRL